MIDPRNPPLKSRATLLVGPSIERAATVSRKKNDSAFLSSKELYVDRVAFTQVTVILFFLMVLYLVVGPPTDDHDGGAINLIGPACLSVVCIWTTYKIVAVNPRSIWTPMPWFALTSALYFGLGPLVYLFGPEETIAGMNESWWVAPSDLWRTNLLNTISILTIAAAFLATDKLLKTGHGSDRIAQKLADDDDAAQRALFFFLGVGLPLRYLLVLPYTFGQLGFVLPGSLFAFGSVVKLAVFMLAYLGAKRGGLWRAGFWMLFVTEVITNFLCFSKLEVLLVFIMTALGRFQATKSVKELVFAGMATVGIFVLLAPLVTWSRLRLYRETGNLNMAPAQLRLAVAAEALDLWSRGELEFEGDRKDHGLARLCYSNAQTACMYLYDSGIEGDSFAYALYGWIPRIIWPDKPIMALGEDFNVLVTGRTGTCSGAGVFGEAYWNGGWLLVLLTCAYIGALFAWLSRTALRIIARSEWIFLPCAFIGMTMGMRPDDWFAPTFITGFAMYLAYYSLIRLVSSFAQSRD
jgi:hypothetical protein